MPTPYEVLSASRLPAVTNARATGDYFHSSNQWAVGQTALFYWALNILPFKDGFYSSTNKQVGGQTEGPETDPDREAIMATLSAAMVGPMDGIYLLNKSRVMTTCRADGQVLKPDRPLTPPDACFSRGEPTCKVYRTHSDVKGLGRVRYYFNNDGSAPLLADEADLASEAGKGTQLIYNWYSGETQLLEDTNAMSPGYENHIYATVAPVMNGWALLGEVDKYVTAATLRFTNVDVQSKSLTVTLKGIKGETVKVCAAQTPSFKAECHEAKFDADSEQQLTFGTSALLV
jgi:hypothetical protein